MSARTSFRMLVMVFAASCIESTGPNVSDVPGYLISDVSVTPSIDTVTMGDTSGVIDRVLFIATAIGKNGDVLPDMRFVWETSDSTVAIVNATGLVTPLAPGTVEISASADKIGKASLVVLPAPPVPVPPLVPPRIP
jgi:hypothetical protein